MPSNSRLELRFVVLLVAVSASLLGCSKDANDAKESRRGPSGAASRGSATSGDPAGRPVGRAEPGAMAPDARLAVAPAERAEGPAVSPDPAGAASDRVAEAEVRALLQAWLDAQNRGDLTAYLALYAERFVGVKRVHLRTRRYDRKGWAEDRGRMFQRKMTVEAKDVTVAAHSRSAILAFHQTWASGDFKDAGPKQLVVVREGKALRIAREELLASTVLRAPALTGVGGPDLSGGRFFMIAPVTAEHALHVILEHRPSAAWAKPGRLSLLRRGLVVRDVDEAQLPAHLRAWKGKRLQVYAEGKPSCEVAIRGFALLGEVVPHFGTTAEWEGQQDGRKRSDDEVAAAIWALATGNKPQTKRGPGLWLVARLDKDRRACLRGAAWARDAALPPPLLWQRAPAGPLAGKALAALRALQTWSQLQAEYRKEQPKGLWDEHEGARPRVDVFRHPTEDRRVVVVAARAGDGCGRFEGQLWAAWAVEGTQWTRLTREETGRHFQAAEAFGASGDGWPQLLDPFALAMPSGKRYAVRLTYEPPFYDCGC